MGKNKFQKVGSVFGSLHGAVVQANLEQAGIPVILKHDRSSASQDILVPVEKAYDAWILLSVEHCSNETLSGSYA